MNILTFVSAVLIIFNSLISSVLSHTCVCAQFTKEKCDAEANCCWNENVPQTGNVIIGIRGKCRSVKYLQCKADEDCHIKYNLPSGEYQESFVSDKVAELVSAYNKLHKDSETEQSNDVDPTEGRVLDWPWACADADKVLQYTGDKDEVCSKFTYKHFMGGESGEPSSGELEEDDVFYTADDNDDDTVYAADPVDVTDIEIAAQRLYYAQLKVNDALEKTENNISSKPGATYQAMSGLQIGAGIVFIVLLFSAMCYWQCNKDKMDKDNKFISLADGNTKGTYSTFN